MTVEKLTKEVERLEAEKEKERRKYRGNPQSNNDNVRNSSGNTVNRSGGHPSENVNVRMSVETTFYTANCAGCSGITATGIDVRGTIYTPEGLRVIAVDPSVIPMGSVVKVTLMDGSSFKAKAADTGGSIKGNKIDLLVDTESEALKLGRQTATVEILTK